MTTEICNIFTPRCGGGIQAELTDIEAQLHAFLQEKGLDCNQVIMARFYLTDAINLWPQVKEHAVFRELQPTGACCFIEQPPLGGGKVALLVWFTQETKLARKVLNDGYVLQCGDVKYVFQTVRLTKDEAFETDAYAQTMEAFGRHASMLRTEGMNLEEHCHRTWIYVRDIDPNYQGVVDARNEVFLRAGLRADTHYIASTGIGGYPDNPAAIVSIDFFSVKGIERSDVKYLQALDYLNPTSEYGVAFERATAVDLPTGRHIFISGTASIDCHGQVLHIGNVEKQTERLFLNISKLLEDGKATLSDMKYFLVYLRDISDHDMVKSYLDTHFPNTPYVIMEARVCRPTWLIEVEGMAVTDIPKGE